MIKYYKIYSFYYCALVYFSFIKRKCNRRKGTNGAHCGKLIWRGRLE
jgi:hypothetical protein